MKFFRRFGGPILLCLWLLAGGGAWAAPAVTVSVNGVSGEIRSSLLDNLSLARERGHPLLSELRIERLHRRAPAEIRAALQPFGYYEAQVIDSLSETDGVWHARYEVRPGRPVRVASVDLAIEGPGSGDAAFVAWRESFPLGKGDILLHKVYENAKDDLLRIGRERGYLESELTVHEVRVRTEDARADITIHYRTGPRYRFGKIEFSEVTLAPEFLQRFPDFYRGDYYEADKVFALHRDLTNSDYFDRVEVVPRPEAAEERRIPVDVTLEMRKRDRYTVGLGYGTDTGPRIRLGGQRRWANDKGHRFGGELLASENNASATVFYRIPLKRPNTDFLGFSGQRERERVVDTVRDTSTVSVNLTHLLRDNWLRTASLNYREERFEVDTAEATEERSTMLYPGLSLQRVEADDRLFPTNGWRLVAEGRVAAEDLSSSTSLAQGRLAGKAIFPLLGGRVISRFDVAASYVSKFDELPVSLRYFAGGDQSVRGFAYQSLDPADDQGVVEGGPNLLVGSVEYDYYFGPRWGAAVFTDVGNAFISFDDYELHQGTGVGLRWRLPFGLIRLDVASAVSEDGKPWRVHFSIGPDL